MAVPSHFHYFRSLHWPIFPKITPGCPAGLPKKNVWDRWCEAIYRLDVLPVTQPTVLTHWRNKQNTQKEKSPTFESWRNVFFRKYLVLRMYLAMASAELWQPQNRAHSSAHRPRP